MEERNSEILTNELLASYIKEFNDDVKLTATNLREKSMLSSSIWAKWTQYLFKEKENIQRIQDTKKKVLAKKTAGVRQQDSVLRLKSEDKIAENDETMKKLADLQKKTQTNIDYIEHALNILQNFGFNIKNAVEVWKMNFDR